jgi:S1-C subfamily serine protease
VRVSARRRLPASGIIWSSDGSSSIIVTANHVVERDDDITITTADDRELPATLIGRDPRTDLVALRVDEGLSVASRVDADAIRAGALVFAVGRAGTLSATSGVVSAVAGRRGGRRRRLGRLISTDAPMFPGFSGGPLADASGRVLGVLSSHLGRGQTLAIPCDDVDRIINSLGQHGRVRRGYLGVGAQPVRLPGGETEGLLIVGIEEDGPAHAAGLIVGDIVLSVSDTPVSDLDGLRAVLDDDASDDRLPVSLLRGGQRHELTIAIGEHPA